jgi:hypothetical protein
MQLPRLLPLPVIGQSFHRALWRPAAPHVRAVPSDDQSHALVVLGDVVYTVDSTGSVRAWTADQGNLLWDAQVNVNVNVNANVPQIHHRKWNFLCGGRWWFPNKS